MFQRMGSALLLAAVTSVCASGDNFSVMAYANAGAQQGPNYAGSFVKIENGVISFSQTGPGGGWATSPIGAGATSVRAYAGQPGNAGTAQMTTAADLSTGRLRASANPNVAGSGNSLAGIGQASFTELVTFTNTNLGDVFLPFSWAIDGSISSPYDTNPLAAVVYGYIYIHNLNGASTAHLPNNSPGLVSTFYANQTIGNQELFGGPGVTYGSGPTWNLANTTNGATMGILARSGILIPTGTQQVLITGYLDAYCNGASTCDFGNTAQFNFGAVPQGLTWTSASGVFLSGLAGPPSAVPEPGTYAMMGIGLAILGGARYRRIRQGGR